MGYLPEDRSISSGREVAGRDAGTRHVSRLLGETIDVPKALLTTILRARRTKWAR